MNKFFNRPLSPHLSIYIPQVSSLSSIWHRITAVYIFFYYIFFLLLHKIVLFFLGGVYGYSTDYFSYLNLICNYLLFISLYYHFLNGLRHIFWDISVFLTRSNLTNTSILIFISVFISQILFFKSYLL